MSSWLDSVAQKISSELEQDSELPLNSVRRGNSLDSMEMGRFFLMIFINLIFFWLQFLISTLPFVLGSQILNISFLIIDGRTWSGYMKWLQQRDLEGGCTPSKRYLFWFWLVIKLKICVVMGRCFNYFLCILYVSPNFNSIGSAAKGWCPPLFLAYRVPASRLLKPPSALGT